MPIDARPTFRQNPSTEPRLRLTSDSDGAVVQLGVRGRWDWQLFLAVRTAVSKCLVEHPTALILDLRALDDAKGSSVSLWFALRRNADGMQPPVRMALCVPPETPLAVRLRQLGAKRFLPIFATVTQARTALAERLAMPERLQLRLPASPESASLAGLLVADACRAWELPLLLHRARLVMFELVVNAVEHAGTDLLVTVARRDDALHLAVRDGSVVLPRRLPVGPMVGGAGSYGRGQGLQVVDELARSWGARHTYDGTGKVVWATIWTRHARGDGGVETP
jgi:histidine kinase/DNA gyrase B/HSP90-like ATPase